MDAESGWTLPALGMPPEEEQSHTAWGLSPSTRNGSRTSSVQRTCKVPFLLMDCAALGNGSSSQHPHL